MTDISEAADWRRVAHEASHGGAAPAHHAAGPDGSRRDGRQNLGDVLELSHTPWRGAFTAARRHSLRVRVLRWSIVLFCLVTAGAATVYAVFDPFRRIPPNITIGQVRLDGTRITVETPKISGFQKDGRPYDIKAEAGRQDTTTPNLVELSGIDARVAMRDSSTIKVTAAHGSYDNLKDSLLLDGAPQIRNEVGYAIFMKSAQMDFKTGGLVSHEPVTVLLKGGTIAADEMDIGADGKISFVGGVRSTFDSSKEEKDLPLTLPEPEEARSVHAAPADGVKETQP
ncbi:hypothetical protein [Methylocella sp.]|uniref:hypothetical protein n=1 Tax=Methylocella sp. TaxID=1978226 RepID=UPI00378394A7